MIGLALCGLVGIALLGTGIAVLRGLARRPCEQCREHHADPLDVCDAEPLSLRPVELKRRGIGK
jgi:hypothetical protein